MTRQFIVGVLIGGVVDVISTYVLAFPIAIYVFVTVSATHVSKDHLAGAYLAALHGRTVALILQWVVGGLGTIIGGYVAAWIAKMEHVAAGTLSSYLCLLIAIGALIRNPGVISPVGLLIGAAASIGFAALGGYLRLIQERYRSRAALGT